MCVIVIFFVWAITRTTKYADAGHNHDTMYRLIWGDPEGIYSRQVPGWLEVCYNVKANLQACHLMPSNNGFRINNRYLLLTYSQVGPEFTWRELGRMLHDLGAFIRLGRELHQDGGTHYHVFCDFEEPFSTRDQRKFDFEGHHPNIEAVRRTPRKAWEYAGKDGDVLMDDPSAEPPESGGGTKRKRDDVWTEITNATSRDEFFTLGQALAPRDFVCAFSSISKYADWKFRPEPMPYTSPMGFTSKAGDTGTFPGLQEWVLENIENARTRVGGGGGSGDHRGTTPNGGQLGGKRILHLRFASERLTRTSAWGCPTFINAPAPAPATRACAGGSLLSNGG